MFRLFNFHSNRELGLGDEGEVMRFSLEIFGIQPLKKKKTQNILYISGSLAAELKLERKSLLLWNISFRGKVSACNEKHTISVRVKKAKYSEAVVFPFWSNRKLLHCGSGLQRESGGKIIITDSGII